MQISHRHRRAPNRRLTLLRFVCGRRFITLMSFRSEAGPRFYRQSNLGRLSLIQRRIDIGEATNMVASLPRQILDLRVASAVDDVARVRGASSRSHLPTDNLCELQRAM